MAMAEWNEISTQKQETIVHSLQYDDKSEKGKLKTKHTIKIKQYVYTITNDVY